MFIFNRKSILAINFVGVILLIILLLDIFKLDNMWIFIPLCIASSMLFIYFLLNIRFLQNIKGMENSRFRTIIRYACMIIFIGTMYIGIKIDFLFLYALDAIILILFLFTVQAILSVFDR